MMVKLVSSPGTFYWAIWAPSAASSLASFSCFSVRDRHSGRFTG